MDKPIKRSDLYVCGNPRGFDEFTPVAVVLKRTEKTVICKRWLDHGRLIFDDKPVTISLEDFDHYYHPVNDIEYDVLKCLGHMQFYNDYEDDSEGGLIADD